MLNINQNFDLKAPVFNFDRDYFNSIEELNDYDASNVPNHFVTNVAGMLYLFTDGGWRPIIGTVDGNDSINIGSNNYISILSSTEPLIELNTDSAGSKFYAGLIYIISEDNVSFDIGPTTLDVYDSLNLLQLSPSSITVSSTKNYEDEEFCRFGQIYVNDEYRYGLQIGNDHKVFITRDEDNVQGATITGVKSITAFANPSATKVWATDGSTVDLATKADASALDAKANASDVLLKKSATGGYYIESNSNELGWAAFAANQLCTASGPYSHAEGASTKAIGTGSHVEGNDTKALGNYAHAEGENTKALGNYSHAEGQGTSASDDSSHAEGNGTDAQNCSHAEGNYTHAVGMYTHAEGEYTSASGSYSHAEGFATYSSGTASHSEGNNTKASGYCSHALGTYTVDNKNAIHSVGIGDTTTRKNAEYIYAKSNETGDALADDPKNGYKYLIGVGGYDGISTDNTTYKSVQEVIADLTARIEQLETKVKALEAANTPA